MNIILSKQTHSSDAGISYHHHLRTSTTKKRNEFCTCFIQFKDAGSLQPVLSKTIHTETLCQKQLLRGYNKRQITFLITKEVAI